MLDWSWLYLLPFSIPGDKKYLHKSETQHFIASVTTPMGNETLKISGEGWAGEGEKLVFLVAN